jgi:hypothetical protein
MLYAKRIAHLPTSPVGYLVALSIVAVLAFTLGVLAGGLQWNEQRSRATGPASREVAATIPETVVGASAMKAASEQYRTQYDAAFAARRGTAAMKAASAEYRAMYDRSYTVQSKAGAMKAASEQYRTLYDATFAARRGTASMTAGRSHPAPPSVRHLRPEQVLTLPQRIQEEVTGPAVQPAQALAPEDIIALPPQIQEQVREATRRGSN